MTPEDIGKVASRSLFISIEQIASPRLIKVGYVLGLCAIALWAINHFFYTFSFGFGEGLWGLIEIIVFGLFAAIALRVLCETLVVFFKDHEKVSTAAAKAAAAAQTSLIDEVRGAIEDLASGDEEASAPAPQKPSSASTRAASQTSPTKKTPAASATPKKGPAKKPARRTAKRDPQAGSAKPGPTDKN